MEEALKAQIQTGKGGKVEISKLGSSSAMANNLVFGTDKPKKVEINASKYLDYVNPTICTKPNL